MHNFEYCKQRAVWILDGRPVPPTVLDTWILDTQQLILCEFKNNLREISKLHERIQQHQISVHIREMLSKYLCKLKIFGFDLFIFLL